MSRDVLARKLERLLYYLERLRRWEGIGDDAFDDRQHEIERYLQVLADIASDILYHLVAEAHDAPESKRGAAETARRLGLIDEGLAGRLSLAFAQRNLLVHHYEEIDPERVRDAIPLALRDYAELAARLRERFLGPDDGDVEVGPGG